MIRREDIHRAIYGAWRLAHHDPAGMDWLDLTAGGFVRSFAAIPLLAPFYLVLVLIENFGGGRNLGHVLLVEGLSYVAIWLAFPLLLIPMCRVLSLGSRYVPYIVAYNWSQVVLLMCLWLPLSILLASGLPGRAISNILIIAGFAAAYYYLWFITRTALQTTASTAFGLAMLEYLLGLLIHTLLVRLI